MMDAFKIITLKEAPDHPIIGHKFRAWDGKLYMCESLESNLGFWMVEIGNPVNRRNVSERSIGRTFHESRAWVMEDVEENT